jgi:HAD superfamily phosphoserine phosphatase-like hydrolase
LKVESYKYLDWDKLKDEALPFNFRKEKLNNILVPSIEALCYSKLVSFLGRIEEHNSKISQDLRDVCELSNSDTFRLGVFLNMIASNGFEKELKNNFSTRLDNISGYIGESNLGKIIDIFTKEEEKSDSIREPSHINKTLLQPRPRSVHSKNKVRIAAFDLDGTLIKGIRHSWTMVWNHLKVDDNDQQRRKEAFRNNELSYLDWCKYDSEACKKHGLKESHFKEISEYDHISVTKNLREGIAKLKENGIKTAIISGGIDAFLYAMIPDADELFDEILINRFVFFPDGSLEKISATEYDWDDSKVGVVGKRRGLERICEKHNISIKDSAFTGDDLNDIEAMKSAGLKIFYCGDTREFVDKDNLPGDIVIISQNNFMNVVDRILTAPTGEQLD